MTSRNDAIAALADTLIPIERGEIAASQAGVPGASLDSALDARPDLASTLDDAVAEIVAGRAPSDLLNAWSSSRPDAFDRLFLLIRGAYFLNATVCERLHYDGATPHPLGPEVLPDQLDLVVDVIARGARHRIA